MKPGWRVFFAGLVSTLLMLALFAAKPSILEQLEWELLDWRFRMRGPTAVESPVVIVGIDAASIRALGRWPWPRSVMAELIEDLGEAGSAAVGIDVTFSEPEVLRGRAMLEQTREALAQGENPDPAILSEIDANLLASDTDTALEGAIDASDRVVLGYFFRTGLNEDAGKEISLDDQRRVVRRARIPVTRLPEEGRAPILRCTGVETSLPRFHDRAAGSGFLNAHFDRDGVIRQAPLIIRCGNSLYPSLALALVEAVVGRRSMVVGDSEGIQNVLLADAAFPTDEGGKILINFRGPAFTFPHLSAVDVLEDRLPEDALAGKIVLVGATEVGIGDIRNTPFGRVFPGVEVHANIIDNLMTGEVLKKDADVEAAELALLLALGLLVSAAVPLLGSAFRGAVFSLLVGGALVAGIVIAFNREGLWINLAYPGLTVIVTYIVVAVSQSITVERSRRHIRQAFATYVPPGVVDEMTRSPESFHLGGEVRSLSILFSDIRSFTTLSQNIGAEGTANLLNVYLTEMTTLIFDSRGTLDKYIGDAVMAFWGAPLPVEDHSQLAAGVAIDMQERIAWLKENKGDVPGARDLRVGIGIHSADVVVGNLGSELRFDYTLSGDGVNLCSRLESLTKYYGVGIITSEALAGALSDDFRLRPLDTIQVVGKDEPTRILELRGRGPAPAGEDAWLTAYAEAEASFRSGAWDRAESAALECQRLHSSTSKTSSGDGPTQFLLERIRSLEGRAPSSWQGTWVFDTK